MFWSRHHAHGHAPAYATDRWMVEAGKTVQWLMVMLQTCGQFAVAAPTTMLWFQADGFGHGFGHGFVHGFVDGRLPAAPKGATRRLHDCAAAGRAAA